MNMLAHLFFNRVFVELSGYEGRDTLSYENEFGVRLD